MRTALCNRETTETSVSIELALDEDRPYVIDTGYRMLNHLLGQFAFHSCCALQVRTQSKDGIEHHAVEDVAIVLGKALGSALADRAGIERYGLAIIPMDDALVRCAVDLSGRGFARVDMPLKYERIEDLSSAMVPHFFSSFAANAGLALHIDRLAGEDPHHLVEAAFKALGRACRRAWALRANQIVPSTKGAL